ncbi:MAG: hypothetical protein AAGJ46_18800 [Planctomycetota bacterium]
MTKPTPNSDGAKPVDPRPGDAELLERFLDGELAPTESAAAEKRFAEDSGVQQAIEIDGLINASLRRQFQAPSVDERFLERLLEPPASPDAERKKVAPRTAASKRDKWMRVLAVAVTLACAYIWGTSGWQQLRELWEPQGGYSERAVAQVYQEAVQTGFQPAWLCEDDQEFAKTFAERQGQGLLLKPLPKGVRMAGLAYLSGVTPNATSMMAYVDDKPVLVMAARTALLPSSLLKPDPGQGVEVFTRQLGELTLIEATPLGEPRVLPYLVTGEVPPAPTGHVPGTPYP